VQATNTARILVEACIARSAASAADTLTAIHGDVSAAVTNGVLFWADAAGWDRGGNDATPS